jgi:hypothetical protein
MPLDQEQQTPMTVPPFQIPLAVVTKQRFAELTGQDIGVVDAQVDRGYLPSIKIGKHRMVNLARLWVDSLNQADS